jgi:hypothetical protein
MKTFFILAATAIALGSPVLGQTPGATVAPAPVEVPHHPPPPGEQGSPNMHVVAHVPLGSPESVSDVDVEQDPSRPYAYVSRRSGTIGFDVISLADPANAHVAYSWRIENPDLHQGGAMDGRYFKHEGRYYFVQSLQLGQGGPNSDVGAIVFDVTDLPNRVVEVARIRQPDTPGGFHNIFVYKHSSGLPLLFATSGPQAKVFDLDRVIKGARTELEQSVAPDPNAALVALVPMAQTENMWSRGYHDFYVGYHPESEQDRFYGGGGEGYYVYNVTDLAKPELLLTITDVPGVPWGHTFTPSADGRYAIGETEFQYQPLRIFDMKESLDKGEATGTPVNLDKAVGLWQADWMTVAHNHEVRWPYIFVAGYESGFSVFYAGDPSNPYTIGYYDTYDGPHNPKEARNPSSPYTWGVYNGAWGVDVRNYDGLIVTSDMTTGFWAFRMDGFDGWDGSEFGVPNVSSVQDWDNGPGGR